MIRTTHVLASFARDAKPDEDARRAAIVRTAATLKRAAEGIARPESQVLLETLAPAPRGTVVRVPGTDVGCAGPTAAHLTAFAATLVAPDDDRFDDLVTAGAFAAAQLADADAEALVEAVAVGLEVAERLRRGAAAPLRARGWDVAGTLAAVAVGCAAVRLLAVDPAVGVQALGIAATQAAGLEAARGSAAWALQAGKAAGNGLEAVLLSRAGFTGPDTGLEGRRGLMQVIAPEVELAEVTAELGSTWISPVTVSDPSSTLELVLADEGGSTLAEVLDLCSGAVEPPR